MTQPSPPFSFFSAGATHVGCVRELNEDAFIENTAVGLWAVADGVGGAAAGDHASQVVVAALSGVGPQATTAELLAAARGKLDEANADLLAYAAQQGLEHVATTVAALLCCGGEYAALWAGDSRIYRLRAGALVALTRDHSAVQELVDSGVLSSEQAANHPSRNIITRAVGAMERLELQHIEDRIEPDDLFLLCSDGLTKVASDEEIGAMLVAARPEAAPGRLIDLAVSRGAPDNLTVIIVTCSASTLPRSSDISGVITAATGALRALWHQ
jgi:serine/threonine protein phosphatase PrpC